MWGVSVVMMLCSLHWLPVAPCICFKTLVLVYHAVNGSGPVYIQVMVKPYTSARPLCSASANRLVAPSLRASHSTKSQLFAVLAPKWWKELPIDIRTAEVKPRTRQVLLKTKTRKWSTRREQPGETGLCCFNTRQHVNACELSGWILNWPKLIVVTL